MLILDGSDWRELRAINNQVNARPGVVDLARYGRADFWTEIDELGGDCEDFALEKRRRLLAAGWPIEALRLAECFCETGERHAVLTVDTHLGTYVLDNRCDDVAAWSLLTRRGYRWIRRQAAGGTGWVEIPGAASGAVG